jgi:hypothetical protein
MPSVQVTPGGVVVSVGLTAAPLLASDLVGFRQSIPLFSYAVADSAVPVVYARAGFIPANYAITGKTTVLTLDAVGNVTGAGLTGTLELLNATGIIVATLSWTETEPTRKTVSVTLPGSSVIWRARTSCTGVVDPLTQYALFGGAHVLTSWS